MEIRALAEQVLFGARLEDKLARPGALTDRDPGAVVSVPDAPARPDGLELQTEDRAPFPALGDLERQGARGVLLHAFANHELLAIELMALALLRFPEAPREYRLGLAHTLSEEQSHLALYLERMRELGVTLGDSPLSAYFWRAMGSLRTPLEFVAAMNLTFEQANLDHALAFARALEQVGDPGTAAILRRVHDEELGHVRHGLTWFDRWRDPTVDRWEAYRDALPEPLSPNRAKGLEFSWESRRRVGFDDRFQRELFVYSRSKGRPPLVFAFNPACEAEVARGVSGAQAPKVVKALERDYAPLLAFVAGRDDVVLVPRRPSLEFLVGLRTLGIELPELVAIGGSVPAPDGGAGSTPAQAVSELAERGVSGVRPWGWSPETVSRFSALLGTTGWPRVDADELRRLYSKRLGLDMLHAFADANPEFADLLGANALAGAYCDDATSAEGHGTALLKGASRVVLKAPWGTSGRGLQRVNDWAARTDAERGWLNATLRDQGGVVVEPWLDRVCDLSLQLDVGDRGARSRPRLTRQLVDHRGQSRGHLLGRPLVGLDPQVLRVVQGDGGRAPSMLKVLERAGRFVATRLAESGFRGHCGIDAFVYREGDALHLKPIVEINPRTTMGRVALGLEGLLRPGRVGVWLHVPRGNLLNAAAPPPRLGGTPPRLERGVLFTNDPTQAESRVSVLSVGATPADCWSTLRESVVVPDGLGC